MAPSWAALWPAHPTRALPVLPHQVGLGSGRSRGRIPSEPTKRLTAKSLPTVTEPLPDIRELWLADGGSAVVTSLHTAHPASARVACAPGPCRRDRRVGARRPDRARVRTAGILHGYSEAHRGTQGHCGAASGAWRQEEEPGSEGGVRALRQ